MDRVHQREPVEDHPTARTSTRCPALNGCTSSATPEYVCLADYRHSSTPVLETSYPLPPAPPLSCTQPTICDSSGAKISTLSPASSTRVPAIPPPPSASAEGRREAYSAYI